ncbi:MAG TPA: 3-oxoadipate enol-lactonase [Rhizomicrobium sp.]|jgi:3-oxoadipate enol-lactonase/4-carboxymuconolactone decarboxylase|nr:3-oxoadipate enol-lactonase [Rhizomicrobium sp.]
MAFAKNGAVRLHWREDGAGPTLLLLNSVGCDLSLWDVAMPYLSGFRVVRMDMRGHGQSDSPPGDYALDQLAADAIAVLDAAKIEKTAVCGLSLGGMTAMTLALNAPERVSSLILACTSAQMDPEGWNNRVKLVRSQGMAAVVDAVMARFFSDHFRRNHAAEVEVIRARFLALDPGGYAGGCAAIRDMALLDKISAVRKATLVIAGEEDVATPFQGHGSEIQKRIAGARVKMLPAAHIAPVEAPAAFAAAVTDSLSGVSHA